MKGKMKKMLLAVGLCLMIGLQSVGSVQAAVNYEACPFCGTMVTREQHAKQLSKTFMQVCGMHGKCEVYKIVVETYTKTSCQTPGCANYDRDGQRSYSEEVVHVISQ